MKKFMTDNPILVKQEFNSTIEKVWKAITDKDQMIKWYFENIPDFKPIIGFETNFNIHHNDKDYLHLWKVTDVIPLQRIVYNWKYKGYAGDSFVVWELTTNDNKTILKFSHHGQSSFPQDNPDFTRESCIKGWNTFIQERLKDFLDKN
jgi:uncharacterized protein YndB with AHSA1/START domain